jgi:hypothetical protein
VTHLELAEQHKTTAMKLLSETPEGLLPPASRTLIANLLLAVEQLILHLRREHSTVVTHVPLEQQNFFVGPGHGPVGPPRLDPVYIPPIEHPSPRDEDEENSGA